MTIRALVPSNPLLNQTVSGVTPIQSTVLNLQYMFSAQAAFLVSVGSGLTATFQIMVSLDNKNFYNSGTVLPSVSGSATVFPVAYSGAFPYVLMQVTPTSGSGTVTITATAKGGS
jgi:hypothetical protein